MNDHVKSQDTSQQDEYARELDELLNLLQAVDRHITPKYVAQRFRELLDEIEDGHQGSSAVARALAELYRIRNIIAHSVSTATPPAALPAEDYKKLAMFLALATLEQASLGTLNSRQVRARATAGQAAHILDLPEKAGLAPGAAAETATDRTRSALANLAGRIIDHRERLAACRKAGDHNGAAQALADLAGGYLALAEAGAPADRVARQLLWEADGSGGRAEPLDEWILSWLSRTAPWLVGQAPQVAAELLRHAVARSPAGSPQRDFLVGPLADALYRAGDAAGAEQVANQGLAHVVDPDVFVDLHWTLAQCRMYAGQFEKSLATLDRALHSPGISARHRARLLVLAARTHCDLGDLEKAGQVAAQALAVAEEAADNWAIGWALHVLTLTTSTQGQMTAALALFDRALTATEADPALTDLRLLLQINRAITLSDLDQYEEAFATARQALRLADQVGTVIRQVQAHGALGQLLFDTGRWDEAIAEVQALPEGVKDTTAACSDLGTAAVICFHRGEIAVARQHLAAALCYAERTGNQVIGALVLARSLDREQAGDLPGALAALTAGIAENAGDLGEIEDLLADAARVAAHTGDVGTVKALADYTAALAAGSDIPHRQATALYCRGLLDHDGATLLAAAERYADASRPLLAAAALEAAAGEFVHAGDCGQARVAYTRAMETCTSLGATAEVDRLQARFHAHGVRIRRGSHAKHRQAGSAWDSLTPTEAKIAALAEEGLSSPRIAAKLLVS